MSIKALYITYDGLCGPIGASQVTAYLEKLSKSGIDYVIISFEKPEDLRNKEIISHIKSKLKSNNIEWIPLKYHKMFRLIATSWDIIRGVTVGIVVRARCKYAIIHSRSFVASVMAFILKVITGTFFIYDVRGFWSDERLMGGTLKKGLLYTLIKGIERQLLHRADHVVVLTEAARGYLESFGFYDVKKVTSIPCCVGEGFRYTQASRERVRRELGLEDRFVVLHAGSLERWYRMDKMLECFKAIKDELHNAFFLVLTSMRADTLSSHLSDLGLDPEAVLVRKVDFSLIPAYISASDLGLFFLKTPPAAAGFSPVKVGEYISCHLPILCNKGIGDMDTLFSRYRVGALVQAYSDQAYRRGLKEVLAIKRDPQAFKAACERTISKELSIDIGLKRYRSIYEGLMSGSSMISRN